MEINREKEKKPCVGCPYFDTRTHTQTFATPLSCDEVIWLWSAQGTTWKFSHEPGESESGSLIMGKKQPRLPSDRTSKVFHRWHQKITPAEGRPAPRHGLKMGHPTTPTTHFLVVFSLWGAQQNTHPVGWGSPNGRFPPNAFLSAPPELRQLHAELRNDALHQEVEVHLTCGARGARVKPRSREPGTPGTRDLAVFLGPAASRNGASAVREIPYWEAPTKG